MHMLMCVTSIASLYIFRNHTFMSMILSELIIIYVAIANYKRREILPALFICLAFKLIEYPVALWQFTHAPNFILTMIGFDIALFYVLGKFYKSAFLWNLFKIDVPQLRIAQVQAIRTLLLIGVFHLTLVLTEVSLHLLNFVNFESVPFFYRTFPEVRATLKALIMLGIWSMMLDSYYHPLRQSNKRVT